MLNNKNPTKTQETDVNADAPEGYTACFSYNTPIITSGTSLSQLIKKT